MIVGDICNREVVFTTETEPIRQAARRMRQHHLDDVLAVLNGELSKLVQLVMREQRREARDRRPL